MLSLSLLISTLYSCNKHKKICPINVQLLFTCPIHCIINDVPTIACHLAVSYCFTFIKKFTSVNQEAGDPQKVR